MKHGLARRETVDTEMHNSGEKRKTFVYTKKRGYDVTRDPHLNKVSTHDRAFLACCVNKLADAFEDCRNFYRCHVFQEFCVCVDAIPTYMASLANVVIYTQRIFFTLSHIITFNAAALAGAVNAALAWRISSGHGYI